MLDTSAYTFKLYTRDGGVKLLKRRSGAIEKQYRQNVGKLPVAYRCFNLLHALKLAVYVLACPLRLQHLACVLHATIPLL